MKRKFNKKILAFVFVGIFAVALATAGVVTYLSNTAEVAVDVRSPMSISLEGDFELPLELYGGDSVVITSTTVNHASVPVENVLVEVKVPDFDGVGITYHHDDGTWAGDIPVCTFGGDAYYYIGPSGGFTAPIGYEVNATSTITADVALEPRVYDAEIKIITEASKAC